MSTPVHAKVDIPELQNNHFSNSPDSVLVIGQCQSQASALAIKHDNAEIVDAIVADDINKLPDTSVADSLQRITGVQIARDRGDGASLAIRGLTQIETQINGREIFTAGSGRGFDFADLPAEMIATIRVYKTAAANQIEGGIGGSIDLITRRPLDFASDEFAGSVKRVYSDLAGHSKPQITALASKCWSTTDGGEVGVLLSIIDQRRAFREDQKSAGNPIARTDIIPGITVFAPNGTAETTSIGERRRSAANLVLQWRPDDTLDIYAEGNYAEFHTRQDSQQISMPASKTFSAGSAELFSGTQNLRKITWTNAQASVLSFARDTLDRNWQLASGGKWTRDALTLSTDISYTKSVNRLFFSGPYFTVAIPEFTQDVSARIPDTTVAGVDLLDPVNFKYAGAAYRTRAFRGDQRTFRFDTDYQIDYSWIDVLSAGVRSTCRHADNKPGLIFADASVTNLSAADTPKLVSANAYNDFFSGYGVDSIRNFISGDIATARNDPLGLRSALGITASIPSNANALSLWSIDEEIDAAYAMGKFRANDLPLDGNLGMRVVTTRENVSSAAILTAGGVPTAIDIAHRYTDFLPSANVRYLLARDFYVRVAASKTLTRPNFDQLSPSLSLTPNSINPSLNVGAGGNPELRPIRSKNFDLALEKYIDANTALYASGFSKQVNGFITNVSAPEEHDGALYLINRPYNTDTAHISGIETGYQQFYSFLPGWLHGFGLQLNYTYVDSNTANNVLGKKTPLQNLSRHSYNIIAMYEAGSISARVAYNWRDRFFSGVVSTTAGAFPVYTADYGWLDASLRYHYDDHITFSIEGTNLLHTLRSSDFGSSTRPQSSWINDRQIGIGITARL